MGLSVYWLGGFNGVKCVLVGWVQWGYVCTDLVDSRELSVLVGWIQGVKGVLVGWNQGG